MQKQSALEKRKVFKTSKTKNRMVQSGSNQKSCLNDFQRMEVTRIQSTLDLIDEKIYSIRKRMDQTSEYYQRIRFNTFNYHSFLSMKIIFQYNFS